MYKSRRSEDFYIWIKRYIERNGKMPCYREISIGMKCYSKSTVFRMIEKLKDQGLLKIRTILID